MRSYNNLYEPMLQDDYIKQRFINASKKKKNRNDVREVLENLDEHTELLKKMLTEELFIPDYHKPSIINESSSKKTRRILKPHYKYEQVIHHCAIGQFKPIVMNGLYEFSCGSIPDRGVHYGKKYMRKWLDSYDGKKFFVLKMDVHHFFESINRRILKRKLKAVIRDKRFYRLLCILIEHDKIALVAKILTDAGVEIDAEQTKTLVGCIAFDDISGALEVLREIGIAGAMFEELKIIIEEMRKGVPLGYFTSQWFGNFYLKALDHYIKEELHAEHYMRYMDDMVILGKSKKKLHKMHRAIETYLNDNLDLEIKGDWQVFRFEYPVMKDGKPVLDENRKQVTKGRMLDFMGFQFHHDRTTIRKSNIEAARRKANHISKQDKISWYNASVMLSYMGLFKHTDTYNYYIDYIKPKINVKKLKRIVSKHSRKENEHDRLEKGDRNTAGTSGGNRQDIVSVKASNYDPAQITIACEADCSSGVAAIVKGAGYRLGNEKMKNVSIYLYTGNMRAGLKAAGFEVLTDSKYLTSDAYLLEGDITLNDDAHVAVNLTDGAKSSGTGASNTTTVKSNAKVDVAHGFNKSLAGTYKVTASGLNLRAGAGTGKSILAVMKNGEKVQCYGYYNDCNGVKWLYVVYKNIVGYASSKYLSK